MSEPLKHPAAEASKEEPTNKKVKVTETADLKNGATANEKVNLDINNGANSDNNKNDTKNTPSKVANGNEKESKTTGPSEEVGDEFNDAGNPDVFDPIVAMSLEQVESIQLEICSLNEKASEEILKVEQKYNKLRRPHFEKRNELLKEIPNFWLTSLANHPIIASMIESTEDEDLLHYMDNLDVEEYEDIKSGYKLKLHFVENPYITNEVLTKEFQIVSSEEVSSVSTPIEFKNTTQGKNLKQVIENSIAQYRRDQARRPGQTHQSFFAWLVEPTESGNDDVAEILKDQIWPNPLEFFFATPEEYSADDDDESDDEDEEIDDEEIDDEDGIITEGIDFSEEELEGEEGDVDEEEEVQ